MINIKQKFRNWIELKLEFFGFYPIKRLVVGGHCGCCGKPLKNEIFPADWRWGICENGCENLI
jgi:hypothetical protein